MESNLRPCRDLANVLMENLLACLCPGLPVRVRLQTGAQASGMGRPYFKGLPLTVRRTQTGKRKPWCNESMASIHKRAARLKPSEDTDTPVCRSTGRPPAATSKAYLQALATNPANLIPNDGKSLQRRDHDRNN